MWSRRWSSSETGRALKEVFSRVSTAWTTLDAAEVSRSATLIAAWFLVGHCHIGAFYAAWDPDQWVVFPWCGDDLTHDHFIWSCSGLSQRRLPLLRGVGPDRIGGLEWLVSHFGSRIDQIIRSAGRLLEPIRVSQE